jgi:hypothetical protein
MRLVADSTMRLTVKYRRIERFAVVELPVHDELILAQELDRHRLPVHHNDTTVEVFDGGRARIDESRVRTDLIYHILPSLIRGCHACCF